MDKKAERLLCDAYHRGRLAEVDLKVVLYRRHDTENGKVWDMKRSHTFSAAFSRRACREQAKTLARQWADKYGAKVVKRG